MAIIRRWTVGLVAAVVAFSLGCAASGGPSNTDTGTTGDVTGEDGTGDSSGTEECNGYDDDGDTLVDEGFDLLTDPSNCGECGNECDAGLVCGYMVCTSDVCAPGEVYCYGNCTSLEGDPFNCGECGNACDPDLENCMEGECVPAI